ncbi:MAG: DUF1566 domain-containing protein [Pseudomonadota bacterium]
MNIKAVEMNLGFIIAVQIIFSSFFLSLASCSTTTSKIPITGQTNCYSGSKQIICPQIGEPFYGQDAQYSLNQLSYTKLDASGIALPDSSSTWTMVRDNITGLIWENKTHDNNIKYTWFGPDFSTNRGNAGKEGNGTDTKDFIDALNSTNFGGYNDWRLPTAKELQTIVNYNRHSPSINDDYFPYTESSAYWSSTTGEESPNEAVCVYFNTGLVYFGCNKNIAHYARAVRGKQSGAFDDLLIEERMVDNGDGTVTDKKTGLIWQKQNDDIHHSWESALNYCENLVLANESDWRLPNVKELESIADLSKSKPAINPVFPKTFPSWYWSSTTVTLFPNRAWSVNFRFGSVSSSDSKTSTYYVRAVRSGQ